MGGCFVERTVDDGCVISACIQQYIYNDDKKIHGITIYRFEC
jgi:hypothetical protein